MASSAVVISTHPDGSGVAGGGGVTEQSGGLGQSGGESQVGCVGQDGGGVTFSGIEPYSPGYSGE